MIYLDELLAGVDVVSSNGNLHIPVSGVRLDSREIVGGDCFVAIRGYRENGIRYLADAVANGAVAMVFESKPDETLPDIPLDLTWVLVKNARRVLSKMAAALYGRVADKFYTVGITGTNGKTTVLSLIHAIYSHNFKTARIGTLGMYFDGISGDASLTTPESVDIFEFLSRAHQEGCDNLVMEVSSVALKLHRVADIRFSQGVFTTFSGDHLDFHKTMEDYLESKLLLFKNLGMEDWAIINVDDPGAHKIMEHLDCHYLTYGFSQDADVRPLKYKFSLEGIKATLQTPGGDIDIKSSLVGRVNLSNIMAAAASAVIRGISFETIADAIERFQPVKGRLDTLYSGDFSVMVDYAHTDNALESMLKSLREVVSKRIIVVFGAGGGRDTSKRPRMGKAASENADFLVVTSDNPRNEEPAAIIRDVLTGFPVGFKDYLVEPDRKKAIKKAIKMAGSGDLVVIAGKGHEDYQIFKDKTIHFDDYEVARKVLKKMQKVKDA
jgi:UDP-N-acetylmuramoyl-L-alanyl-D-glutamate--2,6-diaminopimelate ligase